MLNHSENFPGCTTCTFYPFCMAEEKNSKWLKQINSAVKQHYHIQRQETLYLPQNPFRNLYAIQQGALKTHLVDAEGNELIRGFYFSGEILGFEAIYTGHYLFSAQSLTDTIVCEIPYDNFLQLLSSNPALQKQILFLVSQQLSAGSYLSLITAEQRLAAFLIDLSKRLHPLEERKDFLLPMSRQDIGNYLKLSAETISRLLSQFKQNKMIRIDLKQIELLQPDKLKLIANLGYNSPLD